MQLTPPEIKDTPEAPKQASERLQKMGPMSRDEKIMLGTMGFAVVLWVTGDAIGVSSVVAAMLGALLTSLVCISQLDSVLGLLQIALPCVCHVCLMLKPFDSEPAHLHWSLLCCGCSSCVPQSTVLCMHKLCEPNSACCQERAVCIF